MNLKTKYLNIDFENPFVLASAPPTRNAEMISRAFEAGWAGAVVKTITKEPVNNLKNRFACNKTGTDIISFKNIELLSELSADKWFEDIHLLKKRFPNKIVIGSIMGDAKDKSSWLELARGCQDAGADLLELNFSCPHGYPEKGMGSAIGQNDKYSYKITKWIKQTKDIKIPVVPKLTAAVTNISFIGEAIAKAGADGICAINTYPSLMGFDLNKLAPKPSVNGFVTSGGYSGKGIKPIALRCVNELVNSPSLPIMGGGGISSGLDAIEFMFVGAPIVQVCTAVMLNGYSIIDKMKNELCDFMKKHNFSCTRDFIGMGNNMIRKYSELDENYSVIAEVDYKKCRGCGKCVISCRDSAYQAIEIQNKIAIINKQKCSGCSLCMHVCPYEAIQML